ncbi:uncharacterized protein LOC107022171 [Solanum pennellii]|uniref:Uncharacterized protein LOC107022171 n=1 Tax=Solanum pennellii TaxID=28526 RepID=A0ABM1GZV9_SOLPN|nr:uncharacterized protein LOC107022171 [Solanum pennellii]
MKQLNANVIQAILYTTWFGNVVPVPKKDGKTRVCVDYGDLNKASPKDNHFLPNIHILVDICEKHEIQSFVDCYAGYHQILIDEEDAEKTAFTTPRGLIAIGFVVTRKVIKFDPSKIKAILDSLPLKNKTEVMSLLGRLNYISRFIAQFATTCEPIFGLLQKDAAVRWTEDCQQAFEKIKMY